MFVLGVVLAVAVGVALGLLGGGGSILTVPILLYVFRLPPDQAIASSLLVVGTTSALSLVPHARAGRVRWRAGALFGIASMAGAFVGGRASAHLSPDVLVVAFGAAMLVTAVAMMRPRRASADPSSAALPLGALAPLGVVVGALTGLVGAGGGFLVVPALVLVARMPMTVAVGTSLLVIAMNGLAGFAGHLGGVSIPWGVALPVVAAAALGSVVGSRLAGSVSPDALRRGFAWLVLVMAELLLLRELPRLFGVHVSLAQDWPWLLLVAVALPALAALARSRRRTDSAFDPGHARLHPDAP